MSEPTQEVLEAYLDYLGASEEGSDVDFDRYCAEHPQLAQELRRVRRNWDYIESMLARAGIRDDALTPPALAASEPCAGDRYRIEDVVARGGMATVWRVWDRDLERHVAMKVLDEGEAGGGNQRLARFLEEARIAAQLDHPGIAPVYEIGADGGHSAYFTMKLVHGWTLAEVIEKVHRGHAGWTLHRAVDVVLKVCEAVAYAHDKGIIHRDLKPSNVMIGRFGEVFVVDWGLAGTLRRGNDTPQGTTQGTTQGTPDDAGPQRTLDGDVIGTPAYMSPEQAAARIDGIDARSDVYAAGAVLYHLLSGDPPYASTSAQRTAHFVLQEVRRRPPRPIAEVAEGSPVELRSICQTAMERDPSERYASMRELADDVRAYLEGRVVRAFRTGPAQEVKNWIKRNKLLAAASLATVSLVVAGGIGSAVARARRDTLQGVLTRVSTLHSLRRLEARAAELWPVSSERVADYEAWLAEATALRERVDAAEGYRDELGALRETARPVDEQELVAMHRAHPRHWELYDKDTRFKSLLYAQRVREGEVVPVPASIDWSQYPDDPSAWVALAWPLVHRTRQDIGRETEGWALAQRALDESDDETVLAEALHVLSWALFDLGLDEEALDAAERSVELRAERRYFEQLGRTRRTLAKTHAEHRAEIERRRQEVVAVSDAVVGARAWDLADPGLQALHDQLAELVAGTDALFDANTGLVGGISPDHGWGVRRRLELARSFVRNETESTGVERLWSEAAREIAASPLYGGLVLAPQVGLLPIGPDPVSGLWEFAHLQSGAPAERSKSGSIQLERSNGLVLVLVPGGDYLRGAQRSDPEGANYDPDADDEGPLHVAHIDPFFVSKFEMTQGQWKRLTGVDPSRFGRGYSSGGKGITPSHPVEEVSWEDCERVLAWMGLAFPTEAQWEYAARAGTTTPRWPSVGVVSLGATANLLDRAAREGIVLVPDGFEDWSDEFDLHAPAGTFGANAFGLHDVLGNVREWCFDAYQAGYRRWAPAAENPVVDPYRSRWRARLYRIVRGGGYASTSRDSRSSHRAIASPDYRHADLGLRPARTLDSR